MSRGRYNLLEGCPSLCVLKWKDTEICLGDFNLDFCTGQKFDFRDLYGPIQVYDFG